MNSTKSFEKICIHLFMVHFTCVIQHAYLCVWRISDYLQRPHLNYLCTQGESHGILKCQYFVYHKQ